MAKSRKGAFVGLANSDYRPFPGSIGSRLCPMPNANFVETPNGEVRRIYQPVEKVGVGPVGGTTEPENKAKTLHIRRIQPLNRGHKRARRGFSTGCPLPGTSVNGCR